MTNNLVVTFSYQKKEFDLSKGPEYWFDRPFLINKIILQLEPNCEIGYAGEKYQVIVPHRQRTIFD